MISSQLFHNLCPEGKLSLNSFTYSLVTCPIAFSLCFISSTNSLFNQLWFLLYLALILIVQLFCYFRYHHYNHDYQIIWRSTLLGSVFGLSLTYCFLIPIHWIPFFLFLVVVGLFHFSEYLVIAITKPKSVKIGSFMLNHSVAYHTALIAAVGEYFIELHFSHQIKSSTFVMFVGLIMCLAGDFLRKLAILTARSNFDHTIQTKKSRDHILVTHGVYSWSRHPSYVGWFWWAIGTQVLLANPVCVIVYTVVCWKFFHERIYDEEMLLVNFFGLEYIEYQRKVRTRLPFITGYPFGE
ncbi:protein-S-isoprenylcysteine O-methyltransferase [Tetranychus urticae]|uniref:Protein-S-isoprenylcysteine O-methyltransferase n=1 Tax=Tetranychus urticae TaxID=32264 RepID=T1KHP5_TETUR|nr:protein-S-isoprenylcysteine O-methyltransferase [Tetranychus urticae]